MTTRDVVMLLAAFSLAFVGLYFGKRFIALRNELLGWEWIILGFSSASMLLAVLTGFGFFESVSYFCDAFSRSFGVPVIATLGFIELFRRRRFAIGFSIALFVVGAVFAAAARTVWADAPALQVAYLLLAIPFDICMVYFAIKLFAVGLRAQGFGVLASVMALLGISLLEGGYLAFPGEATNVFFNWLTVALFVWALAFAQYFYAYRALGQAMGVVDGGLGLGGRSAGLTARTGPLSPFR